VLTVLLLMGGALLAPAEPPPLTAPRAALDAALQCGPPGNGQHEPVLLIHGTSVLPEENWGWNYQTWLAREGYHVCTVRLPLRSMGDIQSATEYAVHAIRTLHARTGRKVDIFGHSQGGVEARWALLWWPDVRTMVDDVVTIGTPHHGSWVANFFAPLPCAAPACFQMRTTSRFMTALNARDETPGGVDYTSIYSLTDEIVQPALGDATARLDGGVNVLVQDVCPRRLVTHVSLVWDPVVFALVLDAFSQDGGANPARLKPGLCGQLLPDIELRVGLLGRLLREALSSLPWMAPVVTEPALAPYVR